MASDTSDADLYSVPSPRGFWSLGKSRTGLYLGEFAQIGRCRPQRRGPTPPLPKLPSHLARLHTAQAQHSTAKLRALPFHRTLGCSLIFWSCSGPWKVRAGPGCSPTPAIATRCNQTCGACRRHGRIGERRRSCCARSSQIGRRLAWRDVLGAWLARARSIRRYLHTVANFVEPLVHVESMASPQSGPGGLNYLSNESLVFSTKIF
jgi:hypothetical protein